MPAFNVRVYGILINDHCEVLVSDEIIRGGYYTKFPGGGLEYGEGTRDCLKREFVEEMDLEVEIGEHIYTTDFFQVSAFNPDHQIISIYYLVKPLQTIKVRLSATPFEFDDAQMAVYNEKNETESFRFIKWRDFNIDSVNLPIEKIVVSLLKEKFIHLNET